VRLEEGELADDAVASQRRVEVRVVVVVVDRAATTAAAILASEIDLFLALTTWALCAAALGAPR